MQRRHRAILAGLAALAPALAPPAFAAGECPAPADLEKSVKQVFKRDITVKGVAPSQLKGLCEVQVSFQGRPNILYADSTGAFFVTGHLIDAKGGLDLTEESLAVLNSFSPEDMKKVASLAALTLGTKGPVVYFATDPM